MGGSILFTLIVFQNDNSWNQGGGSGQPFFPFSAPESAPNGADTRFSAPVSAPIGADTTYFGSGNDRGSNGDDAFSFFGGGGNPFSGKQLDHVSKGQIS